MSTPRLLRGIAFDHPRILDPLRSAAEAYRAVDPHVRIRWDARSLEDFEAGTVLRDVTSYDLVTFDHPHVQDIDARGYLMDLVPLVGADRLEELDRDSIGMTHDSYRWGPSQYGIAVDVSATVAATRVDAPEAVQRLDSLEATLDHFAGRDGFVLPLVPTHCGILVLVLHHAIDPEGARFQAVDSLIEAAHAALAVAIAADPESLDLDPIRLLERMQQEPRLQHCPLVFAYAPFGRASHHERRIRFTAPPAWRGRPLEGVLGGAGIGVSRSCADPAAAAAFGAWVARPEQQVAHFVRAGGHPASRTAWLAGEADPEFGSFLTETRAPMEAAFLRPRTSGFPEFLHQLGSHVRASLTGGGARRDLDDRIRRLHHTIPTTPLPGPLHS